MKLKLLLAIISLFLIAACIQIENVQEEIIEEKNPCSDIVCNENQYCVNGTCVCGDGFKACGEMCIVKDECCTDKDCKKNEVCKNNKCVFSCDKILCSYNEVCDEDLKECVCSPNSRFCNYQQKCLPFDICCDNFDCEGNQKCTITKFSVNVCFEGEQKACKYIGEDSFVYFNLYDNRYKFKLEKIYSNAEIKYSVDDAPLEILKLGERVKLAPRLYIYLQEIKELGGVCGY